MSSYAKSKGELTIDWRAQLQAVTMSDGRKLLDLSYFAADWPTCACGQRDERIARSFTGAPDDPDLLSLGYQFYSHVSSMFRAAGDDEFAEMKAHALHTLTKIEARETVLIYEYEKHQALARSALADALRDQALAEYPRHGEP